MRSRQTDNLGHSPGSRSRKRVSVPFCSVRYGHQLLPNRRDVSPTPSRIFVIRDGLRIVAKRIEHIPTAEPSRIVIKLINLVYGDYERPTENVNIIGRGSWAGKKL